MPINHSPRDAYGTPTSAATSNVYDQTTLKKSDPNTTPFRKRFRSSESPPSNIDNSLISLITKLDFLCAAIAKSDANIKLVLDDNKQMSIKFENLVAAITKSDNNINKLRKENIVMHQELKIVNDLLRSTTAVKNLTSKTNPSNVKTFASVVKSKDVIVIEPKDSTQTSEATHEAVINTVNPVESGVCGVWKSKHQGKVVIECRSKADSENIKVAAGLALGESYIVKTPLKRNPKVRVFGLSNDISETMFLDTLTSQNADIVTPESKVKVYKKNYNKEAACAFWLQDGG